MKLDYPCFKPGECSPDWAIELNGWGPLDYNHVPNDFVPSIPWACMGSRCPTCDAPQGFPCDPGTNAEGRSWSSSDRFRPNEGSHYSRLLRCRKKSYKRVAKVEAILEERRRAANREAWLERQATYLAKKKPKKPARRSQKRR